MPNIAIFIDGTKNKGVKGRRDNTNVYKLYEMAAPHTACLYLRGVGTDCDAELNRLEKMLGYKQRLLELALGIGATERVKKAYEYLAKHYVPGDQLFLFGFSRGAFIARTLACFLHEVGLLFAPKAKRKYIAFAFYLYWKEGKSQRFSAFLQDIRQKGPLSPEVAVPVHFLGQWDTVEALRLLNQVAPSEKRLEQIARREQGRTLPACISHARHALALHDLRAAFEPLLWSGCELPEPKQTLQQVWFAGAHADVGGGYADNQSPGTKFSDLALEWMRTEAVAYGLECDGVAAPLSPFQKTSAPHDSNVDLFFFFTPTVRPQLLEIENRNIDSEYVHESALERIVTRPELGYVGHSERIRTVWEEVDRAAMRLHFKKSFPKLRAAPMSPRSLAADVAKFHEVVASPSVPQVDELARVLGMLTIFGNFSLSKKLSLITSGDWPDHLRAAEQQVLTQLVEPASASQLDRWRRQKSMLEYVVFQLFVAIHPERQDRPGGKL